MKRKVDWAIHLHNYIDQVKQSKFDWGSFNCAHFCAGAVQVMTGKDFAIGFKRAKTTKQFVEALNKKGFDDFESFVNDKLTRIPISRASLGDIAAFYSDDIFKISLGIVNGDTILVMDQTGMGVRPLLDADYAFEV